ncbi:HU family DNA-binding protein [Staphylococcus saprophyticus]|uniref:HU family DNA-binding protein n=1 Tax=Staphylococcus saprophyticus TaxID=29385 RepID=UPI0024C44094|nr:HU family DNA-binding protein [Staphylococcus saprophyticus]MDK1672898.1 HU family DNA-binding protein [Staphylococcus saprophyticus]
MTKLSRKDLVNEVQERANARGLELNKKDTAALLSAVEESVIEAMTVAPEVGYDAFSLGFGTFKIVDVPARSGVSALDGKEWSTPEHKTVRFKLAKSIKDEIKANTSK